jgi:hypothetical protein
MVNQQRRNHHIPHPNRLQRLKRTEGRTPFHQPTVQPRIPRFTEITNAFGEFELLRFYPLLPHNFKEKVRVASEN